MNFLPMFSILDLHGKVMFSQVSVILSTGRSVNMPGPRSLLWRVGLPGTRSLLWVGMPGHPFLFEATPPRKVHPRELTSSDGHQRRWYASYWTAFLFHGCFEQVGGSYLLAIMYLHLFTNGNVNI